MLPFFLIFFFNLPLCQNRGSKLMGLTPKAREMGILTSNHGIAILSSTSLLSFLTKILKEWHNRKAHLGLQRFLLLIPSFSRFTVC
jgi:hypothetical protein